MTLDKALGRILTRCGDKKLSLAQAYKICEEEINGIKPNLKGPEKAKATRILSKCKRSIDTFHLYMNVSESMLELEGMAEKLPD